MGCTVREKHIRTHRKTRSLKPEPEKPNTNCMKLGNDHSALNSLTRNPALLKSFLDNNGWGYCTEEELEEFLLKRLEDLYNEAFDKIIALGYDDDAALGALLRNGHCYGEMDALTNVLHNALAYLTSGSEGIGGKEEPEAGFTDLRQLEEYSLAAMVCLLQQVKPNLSRGDAMWCLLTSDLHVARASLMDIPVLPWSNKGGGSGSDGLASGSGVGMSLGPIVPSLCRFHSGWGFGNNGTSEFPPMPLQREIECPKRFNLCPTMKSLLKKNVTMFAAGFRANLKQFQNSQSQAGLTSSSSGSSSHNEEKSKSDDVVNSVMSKFRDLNIGESKEKVPLDQKDEMILDLVHQVKDLEKQVKERKEWAHQKAMQAARKLSHDLTEIKMLRMERDEIQRLKKGKQRLDKTTMDRLADMEEALRAASGQVDRANAAVRKLEVENAEIRAEMEASKLSASESVTTCLEAAKREKKCLKRLLAWEKQKLKMQEEIAEEKRKIAELEEELAQVEADTKEAEEKWKQEHKSKEQLLAQLDEERRLKEASEANNKRKLEALRLKVEVDFQRHKDDLQRLEQEYTRLTESTKNTETEHQYNDAIWTDNTNAVTPGPQRETIARLLHELDQLEDCQDKRSSCDRVCMICKKDEVSVVFLPCTHQVICANCNESYGKKGKAKCPCCRVQIEQRIRVYGASS